MANNDASARPERVVVLNDLSTVRGGATSIALTGARLTAEAGIDVTFISGDDATQATAIPGVTFAGIASAHILEGARGAAFLRGLSNRDAERFVRRFVAQRDTPRTVYHVHGWSKILSPSVFQALHPVRDRVVVSAHDFFLACPNGGYFSFQTGEPCELRPMGAACIATHCDRRSRAHKAWRTLRQGLLHRIADFDRYLIAPVHEGMSDILALGGIPKTSITALRNPVVPWSGTRVHAETNRTFVYVGRLELDKGPGLLAQAARIAGVPLRIIGDGPLATELRARFPEVDFAGWKSGAEIAQCIADARVLVMPSRYREAFGLVALEAVMSGLPVIVPHHAMLAPEIVGGGFGLACHSNDVADLAATLGKAARDDTFVALASRRGISNARSLAPTPQQWQERLLALYARRLATASPPTPAVAEAV